jgi:ferrous iron transport protein B
MAANPGVAAGTSHSGTGKDATTSDGSSALPVPSDDQSPSANSPLSIADQMAALDTQEASLRLQQSYAGHLGRLIEPAIAPLGFDWKMGIGIVSSFAAREVFVSTMSTVYNVGKPGRSDAGMSGMVKTLRDQRRPDGTQVYTALTALTLMVFYVFALQCVSTVAIVRRETNSWKWPLFQWFYMGILAWGLAFLTCHVGRLMGWS